MRRWQLVLYYNGSVEGMYAFIFCTKWRSGQVLPMPYSLTDWQLWKKHDHRNRHHHYHHPHYPRRSIYILLVAEKWKILANLSRCTFPDETGKKVIWKFMLGEKQNQPSRSRPINCLHQLQLKTFFSESKFDDLLTSIWRSNNPLTSICMMKWWSVDINKTRKCFVDINDEVVSCWWSYDQLPSHDVMICWHYCSEVMNMTHWHQYDEVMICWHQEV